ncbi:hypothetical protein [Calothrix sp. 336/3]|uniref:hypothetical protein n=1 Tax=Calothrix sp. 336/3 TaxID=1337936 RepID=UPI0004E2F14F|nr:hypothetical protein [Calothrix sp. 336/3]AKG20997.1 hypothetical protein IJ00_06515 [Calothrix sp. 336/3]
MQFSHSIKSAKALGLAAVAATTMMSANIAPTMAQTASTHTITFHNAGFYNADFLITHSISSRLPSVQAINIPLNQRRSFQIPSGSVVVLMMRKSDSQGVFFRQKLVVKNNICFQSGGTLFNATGKVVSC